MRGVAETRGVSLVVRVTGDLGGMGSRGGDILQASLGKQGVAGRLLDSVRKRRREWYFGEDEDDETKTTGPH